MVRQAQTWRWSSLWQRVEGNTSWLSDWPEGRPGLATWLAYVNGVETEAELAALRR